MNRYTVILFVLSLITIVACEPNDEFMDEYNAEKDKNKEVLDYFTQFESAPEVYTLTEDDYALSSNEAVANYKNFSNSATPGEYLPEILNKKFVAPDKAEIEVFYDFYQSVNADENDAVQLSGDDYDRMGQSYNNFEDEDEAEYAINAYVNEKLQYQPYEKDQEVTIEYTLYSTGDERYIKVNEDYSTEVLDKKPDNSYVLTHDDYVTLGNGNYDNFNTIDEALNDVAQFAEESGKGPGNYTFEVYRNYYDKYLVYRYDGASFVPAISVREMSTVFTFKLDVESVENSFWWKDPNVYISLGPDDYQLIVDYVANNIGAQYTPYSDSEVYYGASAYYGNFDLRDSKRETSEFPTWQEAVAAGLSEAYLPIIAPEPVAQRYGLDVLYIITFDTYDGNASASYEMQFRVASEAPNPQFELVEGPTLVE